MEMEQEIESIFENTTERPTVDHNAIPTSVYIFRYLEILVCLLGFLMNVLIVFVVLKSKQMKTRTNLVFINRCIYDSLYLLDGFIYFFLYLIFGEAIYKDGIALCTITHTMGLFETALLGFTLMLLSSKLVNSKELSTRTLLTFGNVTVLVYYVAQVIQCVHECSSRHVVEGLVALTLGGLLVLVTLTKDVNRCRRNASIPICKDSKFRLNIARILTYNWTLCFFLSKMSANYFLWRFFQMCMSSNAVFTFVYVFCADEEYKKRILKVLHFNFDLDEEDSLVENCVYAKTTRKNQNIVVDFKPLDDVVVKDPW